MTLSIDAIDADLTGSMFGTAMVIQLADDGVHWHALCECNQAFLARAEDLLSGIASSCGCLDRTGRRGASWPRTPATSQSSAWKEHALCAQFPGNTFYPEQGGRAAVAEAKRVCLQCDVRVECLEWALDVGDPHGIWGGLTSQERKKLLVRREIRPDASGFCGACGSDEHEFVDCNAGAGVA